jgi:hypothetical protein
MDNFEMDTPGLDEECSALDEDLKESRDFYSQLQPQEKVELRRLLEEAVSVISRMSNLSQLHIRSGFHTRLRHDESDDKRPNLSVRTLRRAIEAWDLGKGYAPNEDTVLDDKLRAQLVTMKGHNVCTTSTPTST